VSLKHVLSEIQSILQREGKVYEALRVLLLRENQLLIETNISEMPKVSGQKEFLLRQASELEKQRRVQMLFLAREMKMDEKAVKLKDLIAWVKANRESDEFKEVLSLEAFRTSLEKLVSEVIEMNRRNQLLTRSALRSVEGALKSLAEYLGENVTYKKKGKLDKTTPLAGSLVRKQV